MPLGKPAITDPRTFDLRAFQGSVSSIRERMQFIEQALATLITQTVAGQTTNPIATLQQQIQQLGQGITQLTNNLNDLAASTADAVEFMTVFNALGDGFVVKVGNNLAVVRTLLEGRNIAVNYPDGVDADPVISYEPTGFVLPLDGAVALTGLQPLVLTT